MAQGRNTQAHTSSPWSSWSRLFPPFPRSPATLMALLWRVCRRPLQLYPQHRHRDFLHLMWRTKVALRPCTRGASDVTLVNVLLVWSVCSDVTESGTQGLPQAAASPPPSGQGLAGQVVLSCLLTIGSTKAEAVGKGGAGEREEAKGRKTESGFAASCGRRQPLKELQVPQPRPRHSHKPLPQLPPGWPDIC